LTAARLKRLQRLESRRPSGPVWRDPFDLCMALLANLEAVRAGLACWIPRPEPELGSEAEQAFKLAMRDADRMHDRLMAEAAGKIA
jgi:hypothetical protein